MMRATKLAHLAVLLLATVSLPALAQPNPAATQPFAPSAAPAPVAPRECPGTGGSCRVG